MRAPQRIPILLEKINFIDFITDLGVFENPVNPAIEINNQKDQIAEYWLDNPDQRLTQVMVNMGYLPNAMGHWYYIEETIWAIDKGLVAVEDINFWGVNYDKDGNLLPKTIYKPLRDLEVSHMENIIKHVKKNHGSLPPAYLKYFQKRIVEQATAGDENSKAWVDNLLTDLGLE